MIDLLGANPDENLGGKRPLLLSVLVHTSLIGLSLFMLYPMLWLLFGSFRPANELFGTATFIPESFDVGAYVRGWFALPVDFGRFFANSTLIAILSVIGNVATCSLAAFAFSRLRFPGRNILFGAMLSTLMIPYHVLLLPQYVVFLNLGWVNSILPLVVPKFLAADAFFIFLIVQFMRGIPRELDDAAKMDGCSAWRLYWKVILPLSTPVLATAAIFSFLWTWDDFFGPLIYLNNIDSFTVPLGLRSLVDSSGRSDWGGLFAMSVLSLLPMIIVFILFQRLLIDGIATSGMKR
jgi:multiple sugar transport system permease protein